MSGFTTELESFSNTSYPNSEELETNIRNTTGGRNRCYNDSSNLFDININNEECVRQFISTEIDPTRQVGLGLQNLSNAIYYPLIYNFRGNRNQ